MDNNTPLTTSDGKRPICGVMMPISEIDGCNEQHWSEVREIIYHAILDAGFSPNLVSNSDSVSIIHKRIIKNIYDNPIAICDVSGKNPNVMFELGIRLAFDKPTIIIKDDQTPYSFDTAPIEHIGYPRDLRYNKINEFKRLLTSKIMATYNESLSDPNYSFFLQHFGNFKVVAVESSITATRPNINPESLNTIPPHGHQGLHDGGYLGGFSGSM